MISLIENLRIYSLGIFFGAVQMNNGSYCCLFLHMCYFAEAKINDFHKSILGFINYLSVIHENLHAEQNRNFYVSNLHFNYAS